MKTSLSIVETVAEHLAAIAQIIAHELQASLDLKGLAQGNSDLLGGIGVPRERKYVSCPSILSSVSQ